MLRNLLAVSLALGLAATAPAFARGSHSGGSYHPRSSSSTSSPGYHFTRSYTTRRGTYVKSHYDTNPDKHFGNNWSTKGNTNPMTGKAGTKVTPPHGEKY